MPLKKAKNAVSLNIKELMNKPSKTRSKAIHTIATKNNITEKQAQHKQAIAIALSSAGIAKSKKKK